MAKCRDCRFVGWNPVCQKRNILNRDPVGDESLEWDCVGFQPGPPPLVVGLAEGLYWLLNLHHNVSKAGNDPETGQPYLVTDEEWKAAIDEGMRVHARYQKEMVDGEDV